MIEKDRSMNWRVGESEARRSSSRHFLRFSPSPFHRFIFFKVFLIAALSIFIHSEVWGFNWKYYGTNEEGSYFYETESMTRLPDKSLRLCVQAIYTEKGVSHWVKEGGKEFQNLDFTLILSEFNCVEKSIRHLRIAFYSKNQKVFYPIQNDEWQLFVPDSMSGALFQEICK